MKKILYFLLYITVVGSLLYGCSRSNKNSMGSREVSNYGEGLGKAQAIEAINPENGTSVFEISDKEGIEEFITTLNMDNWTLDKLPEDAKISLVYYYSQEETIKFGQTERTGELNVIGKLTAYKEVPYLTFEIMGMPFDFKIPDEVAEYLNKNYE